MAKITFKGKVEQVYNMDDTPAFLRIKVPEFKRSHCDMAAFRKHPKYGGFANSDLFAGILARIRRNTFGQYSDYLRLDQVPEGVNVDASDFLAIVSFEV